jgi:hypothetical protein
MRFARSVAAAVLAGLVMGLAAGSDEAQAIKFPLRIDFSYCWGYVAQCPFPATGYAGSASWLLQANNTYQDSQGASGTYVIDLANQRIQLTYPAYNTVYSGQHVGGGCFQGTMQSGGYSGTWAGCK